MKNIIITGGAGFIGSNLAETILKKNLAKKIYVIDNGSVVAEGKHNELLESSDIYKNFYNKQIKNN